MKKIFLVVGLTLSLLGLLITEFDQVRAKTGRDKGESIATDTVTSISDAHVPWKLALLPSAPTPPCAIISYAPCNYLIPANDYASFSLSPNISFSFTSGGTFTGLCPKASLNTVTISFQAPPPAGVALVVWLSGTINVGGTTYSYNTQPVYMTNATQSFSTNYFTDSTANPYSWFSNPVDTHGTPSAAVAWTNLNVQAIYPSPPPSSFYYPQSCTIVYQ